MVEGAFFHWRDINGRKIVRPSLRDEEESEKARKRVCEQGICECEKGGQELQKGGLWTYSKISREDASREFGEESVSEDAEPWYGWRRGSGYVAISEEEKTRRKKEEALVKERVYSLKHRPLLRNQIALRRFRMNMAAMERVLMCVAFQKSAFLTWFTDPQPHKNTAEWHEWKARRLKEDRECRRKTKKAAELRMEDATRPCIFDIGGVFKHHFQAGPKGRLPQ